MTGGTPSASISLTEGENALLVVVTAEDRSTTETYTVTVTRDTATGTPGRVPKPTVTSSQRQMTVTWLEPERVGASAITGYDVQFSRGAYPQMGHRGLTCRNINHDNDHRDSIDGDDLQRAGPGRERGQARARGPRVASTLVAGTHWEKVAISPARRWV